MTRCPKCNGHNIGGPRYEREWGERLIYVCATCGYTTSTPTADTKPKGER